MVQHARSRLFEPQFFRLLLVNPRIAKTLICHRRVMNLYNYCLGPAGAAVQSPPFVSELSSCRTFEISNREASPCISGPTRSPKLYTPLPTPAGKS
jgi:hypothetical protein